jgi:hypothetical protein
LGLTAVSRELKLDYCNLKRRAAEPLPQPLEFCELLAENAAAQLAELERQLRKIQGTQENPKVCVDPTTTSSPSEHSLPE